MNKNYFGSLFVLIAAACSAPPEEPRSESPPRPVELSRAPIQGNVQEELATLRGLAVKAASWARAPMTSARVVPVTGHQAAAAMISGSSVDTDVPVYVMTLTGTGPFHATGFVNAEGIEPTGNVLVLTIDAATHRLLDQSFQSTAPDMTPVQTKEPVELMEGATR